MQPKVPSKIDQIFTEYYTEKRTEFLDNVTFYHRIEITEIFKIFLVKIEPTSIVGKSNLHENYFDQRIKWSLYSVSRITEIAKQSKLVPNATDVIEHAAGNSQAKLNGACDS